jgi:hypothetical protein
VRCALKRRFQILPGPFGFPKIGKEERGELGIMGARSFFGHGSPWDENTALSGIGNQAPGMARTAAICPLHMGFRFSGEAAARRDSRRRKPKTDMQWV